MGVRRFAGVGDARVFGNAQVYGDAQVYDDAWVSGDTIVFGDAQVFGEAWVFGNARVSDNARIEHTTDYLLIGSRESFTTFLSDKKRYIRFVRMFLRNIGRICRKGRSNPWRQPAWKSI